MLNMCSSTLRGIRVVDTTGGGGGGCGVGHVLVHEPNVDVCL